MKARKLVYCLPLPFIAAAAAAAQPGPPREKLNVFNDPSAPVERRVDDLISHMTLEEKAGQLGHAAPAIPRLGIPEYNWWNEGLHGVARAGVATVFPQAIGMAATFDAPLLQRTGDVISTEFRAKYAETVHENGGTDWYRGLTVWSPNINIFRDPRWGRGQETYGEDPYLTARMGIAFIEGLQGDDPKYFKTIATSKHFAVHSGPESTRHTMNVDPSPHDLEDTFLPAFRATVTEGKAQSVMCVYNSVYGVPGCASEFLLDQKLRKDWGFQGYVVSDCGAAANIFNSHHYRPTAETGVTAGFKAGMDLICGDFRRDWTTETPAIANAVREGLMPESVLDQALRRLFTARIRLGMFDPPSMVPYSRIKPSDNDTPEHRALARTMAEKAIVLLKNSNNLLPLKAAPRSIAVIGPNADSIDALVGNYNGDPSRPVTVLAGIKARFPNAKVSYVLGTDLVGPAPADRAVDQAVAAARNADLVIFVGGLSPRIEGEEMDVNAEGFAGGDRTSIDLPRPQEDLLKRLSGLGKPTVFVLMSGSAVGVNWADQNVPAILEAWYPGEEGGTAIARAIAGDFSPAGRLPVTFYKSVDQLPPFSDYRMAGRTYRYFNGTPLYPFGYGLSYTSFDYGNLRLSNPNLNAGDSLGVDVDVRNAGRRDSDEVVQLYLTFPQAPGVPLRALRGFSRVHIPAGAKQTVHFDLDARGLSSVTEAGDRIVAPGQYTLSVGGGQPGTKAPVVQASFNVTGTQALPK